MLLVVGGGYGVGGWQKATGVTTLPRKHLFTTGKTTRVVHEVVAAGEHETQARSSSNSVD